MILKTYGHATLSFEVDEKIFLITDPWLIGSCIGEVVGYNIILAKKI
jgi:hypothetical protein